MAYGAADSTIVKMAYLSEMANVPADTSASMAAVRDAYKSTMDNIEGMFAKIELQNELAAADLEDSLSPLLEQIANGTYTSDVVDSTAVDLDNFRQSWKAIPKGKEGESQRLKWRSGVNKYIKELEAEDGTLSGIAGMIGSGEYNIQGTGAPNMEFLTTIANYYNKKEGSNMARRVVENNEIVYYANIGGVEVRKTQTELKKLFVPKNPVMQQGIEQLIHNQKVDGAKLGTKYDASEFNNSLEKIIGNDKLAYADFINTKFGSMTKTIKQELHSKDGLLTEDIFNVLTELGLEDFDLDASGSIDDKDFIGDAGSANFLKLTDALTNHNSDYFNLKTAKTIAGTILAAGEGRAKFDAGKSLFNAKAKTKRRGTSTSSPKVSETDETGYTSYDFSQSVTKSKPLKLNGENINIGSLDTIRKKISLGKSFTAGDNFFNPDGNGGWDKLDGNQNVIESYSNTAALVLEGLRTNHEGFQGLTQYKGSATTSTKGVYDISIMEKDDRDVRGMIQTDYPGFKVNKDISGVYDAGVEVIEIVAPGGVDRRVIYLQGEEGTNKAKELKRLNDFIREYSKGKYD
tara:strand:- start:6989 stop:8710 length:1722 start_codon:yes stop_codon:yes gene_type:complete